MGDMDKLEPGDNRSAAMCLVQEWRDYADTLEAFPELIRYASDPERFERELYEATCVLDGTVAGELDAELDAEFGTEDQGSE